MNKFRMLLFNCVGCTNTNQTFGIAFAFLPGETKEDYTWALQALGCAMDKFQVPPPQVILTDWELALMKSFPNIPKFAGAANLLCQWHINKNIQSNCKRGLANEMWMDLTRIFQKLWSSQSENEFYQRWQHLADYCSSDYVYVPEKPEEDEEQD